LVTAAEQEAIVTENVLISGLLRHAVAKTKIKHCGRGKPNRRNFRLREREAVSDYCQNP